jgi:hypothetical protein
LQFIAGYLGFRIPDPSESRERPSIGPPRRISPGRRAETGIADRQSHDREHKWILLLEFLGRTGMRTAPLRAQAAHWN